MAVIMKPNKIVWATLLLGLVSLVTACGANDDGLAELSPEEARAIAKEPYVYGFPLNLFGGVRYTGFDDRYRFSVAGTPVGETRSTQD